MAVCGGHNGPASSSLVFQLGVDNDGKKSAVENDIVQRSKFLAGSREPRAEGRELKTTIN